MSSPKCVIFFEQEIPLILADNIYGILTEKFQECLWRHCQDSKGHWKLILWEKGWGPQYMQRSQSKKLQVHWILLFPPNAFSGHVFLSSSLWEVILGQPETLKLLLRNKLPATSDDFKTHCSSFTAATRHLCTHPSYPSFNSRWCNPGMLLLENCQNNLFFLFHNSFKFYTRKQNLCNLWHIILFSLWAAL